VAKKRLLKDILLLIILFFLEFLSHAVFIFCLFKLINILSSGRYNGYLIYIIFLMLLLASNGILWFAISIIERMEGILKNLIVIVKNGSSQRLLNGVFERYTRFRRFKLLSILIVIISEIVIVGLYRFVLY